MEAGFIDSEMGDGASGQVWPSSLRQVMLNLCLQLGEGGYWLSATICMLVVLGADIYLTRDTAYSRAQQRITHFLHALSFAVILLVFRWPTFIHTDLNTDEDFLIAGALALKKHLNYFGTVDGTTSGPLNMYPLAALALLGMRIDIASARILSLFLIWIALIGVYWTSVRIGSTRYAWLSTITLAVLLGPLAHDGWVHYTTAHVSLCMIVLAQCALATCLWQGQTRIGTALLIGVLIGAMPFAKLQSLLFSLLFLGWFLVLHLRQRGPLAKKILIAFGVTVSFLGPFLLITCLRFYSAIAEDLWISYFETSIYYSAAKAHSIHDRFYILWGMLTSTVEIFSLFLFTALALVIMLIRSFALRQVLSAEAKTALFMTLSTTCTGFVTALIPGRDFTHYLLFFLIPSLTGTALLGAWLDRTALPLKTPSIPKTSLSLLAPIVALFMIAPKLLHGHPTFTRLADVPKVQESVVSRVIAALKYPEDELAVWGWCTRLNAEADISPGSHDLITERHIIPLPVRDYYRQRYINELASRKPAFFADSTGNNPCAMNYNDRRVYGHEVVPELRRAIDSDYQFLTDQEQIRLYISYERLVSYIDSDSVYPLIVLLDLTATGSLAYSEFEILFHRMVEGERIKLSRLKTEDPRSPYDIQVSLADRALEQMVSSGQIEGRVADTLRARAARISPLVRDRFPQNRHVRKGAVLLRDPIRIYRRISILKGEK